MVVAQKDRAPFSERGGWGFESPSPLPNRHLCCRFENNGFLVGRCCILRAPATNMMPHRYQRLVAMCCRAVAREHSLHLATRRSKESRARWFDWHRAVGATLAVNPAHVSVFELWC